MLKWLTEKIQTNKLLLLYSFVAVTIFVLSAHAFFFFNLDPSHDYLNEFYTLDAQGWKISIGRFMAPPINLILGQFAVLPWLSGIIMIIVISLSTFLIAKMFKLEKRWQILLLAGLLSTSLSITALTASFMQDLAVDMIALLLTVFSAYQWSRLQDRFSIKPFTLSLLALFFSLGCYQGYLSITIVLIIIKCIENLLTGQSAKKVIKHGAIGLSIIAIASILYFAIANLIGSTTGYQLSSNTTNSLSNVWEVNQSIPERILSTYLYTAWGLFAPTLSSTPLKSNLLLFSDTTFQVYFISLANFLILSFCLIATVRIFIDSKINTSSKILCTLLLIIIPFAMNITHFLSGYSHTLMHYAFVLFYLIFLVFTKYINTKPKLTILKKINPLLIICSGIIVIINIELSNLLYVKKDLEKQSTLSTITRVLTLLESQDDYIFGETKLCLIGNIEAQNGVKNTSSVNALFGSDYNSSITYQDTYNAYFNNVLQYPVVTCTPAEIEQLKNDTRFKQLSAFPNPGSIQAIDDKIVVKMSN